MTGKYEYSVVDFTESLQASFIGPGHDSDERYSPRILANDEGQGANVLSTLKAELSDCTSFAFSVAFITSSGMQVLVDILSDLKTRNIPGKILTSTYLNYNDPDALEKLAEYPNIESRVYQGDLHAKGYFFNKRQISTIIIGSSNLTQRALTCNKEWNILFRSFPNGTMLLDAQKEFDKLWDDEETTPLTRDWIADYRRYLAQQKRHANAPKPSAPFRRTDNPRPGEDTGESLGDTTHPRIIPNKMQLNALEALDVLHERDEPRALLVSATGTGKTYLSALDVERQKPEHVLFAAHRKRILSASKTSFERVLGHRYSYGFYQGSQRSEDSSCMFAMIGTLAKHLDDFSPDDFDYLVIDEAHRTGAAGYRAILDYFKPKFILGMTATPSRTTGTTSTACSITSSPIGSPCKTHLRTTCSHHSITLG